MSAAFLIGRSMCYFHEEGRSGEGRVIWRCGGECVDFTVRVYMGEGWM